MGPKNDDPIETGPVKWAFGTQFDDLAELLGGDRVRVGGPIAWGQGVASALIYSMVVQSSEKTVAREMAPLELRPPATRWELELARVSGPPFREGFAAATGLAIFTDIEGKFSSYNWSYTIHLFSSARLAY